MLDPSYQPAPREGPRVRVMTERMPEEDDRVPLILERADNHWRVTRDPAGVAGEGADLYEATRAILRLQPQLLCCAGCCFLQLTGLTRDMSDGLSGYCLVNFPEHGRSAEDVVSIFDYCERHHPCRETPTDEVRLALWQRERGDTGGNP